MGAALRRLFVNTVWRAFGKEPPRDPLHHHDAQKMVIINYVLYTKLPQGIKIKKLLVISHLLSFVIEERR